MRFHNNRIARPVLAVMAFVAVLSGCGGDTGNTPAPARAPALLAQAGEAQSVSPGDYVLLDGTASRTRGDLAITAWEWTQTGGRTSAC